MRNQLTDNQDTLDRLMEAGEIPRTAGMGIMVREVRGEGARQHKLLVAIVEDAKDRQRNESKRAVRATDLDDYEYQQALAEWVPA